MENKSQINCNCSLINVHYQSQQPLKNIIPVWIPQHIERSQKCMSIQSIHSSTKTKISLSKSGSTHSIERKERKSVGQRPSSNFSENIIHKYQQSSFNTKTPQANKIKKKFFIFSKQQTEYTRQKQNHDLSRTKNTTFDASFDGFQKEKICIKQLNIPSPVASQIKKQSPQKYAIFQRVQRSERPERTFIRIGDNKKATIYQSQNIEYSNSFSNEVSNKSKSNVITFNQQEIRRIKTLKELEYRYAESSGRVTSQNHMSMVVSQDSDLNDLQGLGGLLHKSSSAAFQRAKTQKLML